MLCEEPYIYVGGIDVFMFTIQTSSDGLQNNTTFIIYALRKGNYISQYITYSFNQNNLAHKL